MKRPLLVTSFKTAILMQLRTSASWLVASEESIDHSPRAADTFAYLDCLEWAIAGACAALHTIVFIHNFSPIVAHLKNIVRANIDTHSAALAPILMQD